MKIPQRKKKEKKKETCPGKTVVPTAAEGRQRLCCIDEVLILHKCLSYFLYIYNCFHIAGNGTAWGQDWN